jgi:glycogen debranching enzyme
MKYHFNQNLSERKGVVSNLDSFLNRHLDTGFRSKWSGLWSPPYKFLDYFSIRVNGIWLGPDTVEAVDYGEEMIFYHTTESIRIKEKIKAPATLPGIEVEVEVENRLDKKKAVHLTAELGVDIRHRSEDVVEDDYRVEEGPERISFSRNGEKLMFKSDREFEVKGERFIKEHYPSERQKCLVPGKISFREELEDQETFEMELTTSGGSFGGLQDIEQSLKSEKLGRLFDYSVDSLKNLVYEKDGIGLIAGHPWFQSFWGRDTFWSLLGLIDAGYFELSEDILTGFAVRGVPGRMEPNGEVKDDLERSDTAPLFIIAADKLERHFRTNQKIEDARKEALESLEVEEGVVQHDEDGTWMDTLEREAAVDIQALWLEASEREDLDTAEELREGMKEFYSEDYMKDNLEDDFRSINPAVALMFGHVDEDAEEFLETLNSEFSSRYGARTRSMLDDGYDSSGYHTGSVWGLTTTWAAAANLRHENFTQGMNFLEKMKKYVDRNQPGALPEVVDAETGELLGCSEQAWSAGMIIHVIDSYMLGIKVRDEKVVVEPAGEVNMERTGKKIGDEKLDLKFEDGNVEIMNEPDIEVEVRNP